VDSRRDRKNGGAVEWRNQDGKKKKKIKKEENVWWWWWGELPVATQLVKAIYTLRRVIGGAFFSLLLLFVVLLFIHPFDAFHPAFVLLYFRAPSSLFLASFSLRGSATAYISSYFICLSSFIIN
jgi:hypothetical protein